MNLVITMVDPYHIVVYTQGHFAILLIVISRKTCNAQSLESHNENLSYNSYTRNCMLIQKLLFSQFFSL